MKVNRKFFMIILFAGVFCVLHNVCYAGEQRWNSLEYEVQLREDGSMEIVETWDIYVENVNTLFKDFDLNEAKYSGISNVKVKDLEADLEFSEIDEEMYHVTKNCYYGLPISGNRFEIAWGVGLEDDSANRTYQISYTVKDAVTVYQDCSELYWMFLSADNAIPADKVTGRIKLPMSINDMEKLKVWAHGPLNGEIYKISKDMVGFEISNLDAETMLETRIVVEEQMFSQSAKSLSQNKLEEIMAEEMKWAEQANRVRMKAKVIWAGMAVIYVIVLLFSGVKLIKYAKEFKMVSKKKYQIEIGKYFRDIPREKEATPAEAGFLYYSNLNGVENLVISSTLLQLCLKGYIGFEKEEKDIRINFLKPSDDELRESEKIVYKLLMGPSEALGEKTVIMEEIKKYASDHYDEFQKIIAELRVCAKHAHEKCGNYDVELSKQASRYTTKSIAYMVASIFLLFFTIPFLKYTFLLIAEWMISTVILGRTAKKVNILTEQGETERQQWLGLKRYMEDFSMLKEREIPDLVLWEKYLVYATVFGISEKVIKQLKVVYPQMESLESNHYAYLYLMSDTRFSNGFIEELKESTNHVYQACQEAYSAAHSSSSSGSGSGGGFSSGGGGRMWRRPDVAVDKSLKWRNKNENRN